MTTEELEVLREILSELKKTNQKLDMANSYLDSVANR